MGPPPVEKPDLRVSLSTVGEEDEVTGEVGSVGIAERRGNNSAFMTGAGLSLSTVVTD
jgi:hypothetical protein